MRRVITLALLVAGTSGAVDVSVGAEIPKAMCDEGVFVVGSAAYTFEDIAIESTLAISLNRSGPIVAYGYLAQGRLGDAVNSNVTAKLSTVDICYDIMDVVEVDNDLWVDTVFAFNDFDGNDWRELRRTVLRTTDGINSTALVKVTGAFELYSDTNSLFFRATAVEIVDQFE